MEGNKYRQGGGNENCPNSVRLVGSLAILGHGLPIVPHTISHITIPSTL